MLQYYNYGINYFNGGEYIMGVIVATGLGLAVVVLMCLK